MNKIIFTTTNGLVQSVIQITESTYEDGVTYGDLTAHLKETNIEDSIIITTWHWDAAQNSFALHEPQVDSTYEWNTTTLQYEQNLTKYKLNITNTMDSLATEKIYALYSITKQMNMQTRFMELMLAGQANGSEGTVLQAVWTWIKSIRSTCNTSQTSVNSAVTKADIDTLLTTYQTTLSQL